MTSVTLNNVNLDTLNAWVNQISADKGVKATASDPTGCVVTLTITNTDGSTVAIDVVLPDLDDPEATGEKSDLDKLASKVDSALRELSTGTSSSRVTTSAFSDIYEIFALLLEVAQKERESASQMRAASHTELQTSLRNQAETIRSDANTAYSQAMTGAIVQAVTTGVSTVMTFASMGLEMRSSFKSNMSQTGAKVDDLQGTLSAAKKTPTTIQNELTLSHSEQQMAGFAPEAEPRTVSTNDILENLQASREPADLLDVEQLQPGEIESPMKGVISQDTMKAKAEFETAQTSLTQEKSLLTTLETKRDQAAAALNPDDQATVNAYNEACQAYDAQKLKVDKSQVNCADKAVAYRKSLASDITKFKTDNGIGKAQQLAGKIDEKIGKKTGLNLLSTETQEKLDQCAFLDKLQASVDTQVREPIVDGLGTRVQEARATHEAECKSVLESGTMRVAHHLEGFSMISKQIGETTNAFTRAKSDLTQAESQAKQKETEASQEGIRASIDQYKELYDQEMDVIRAVNDTLKQIIQAENASVEAAINI